MKFCSFILSLLLLASCSVPSDFSTGRVVPVGSTERIAVLGFSNFENQKSFFADTIMDINYHPSFIFQSRTGIAEKVDFSFRTELPILTADADIRYQFLGNYESDFAGAVSLGIRSENFATFSVSIGTNLSWQAHEFIEIYAAPKYVLGIHESNNENRNYLGLSAGVHLGVKESIQIVLAGSYFKDKSNFIDIPLKNLSQFAVGIKFRPVRIRKPWLIF